MGSVTLIGSTSASKDCSNPIVPVTGPPIAIEIGATSGEGLIGLATRITPQRPLILPMVMLPPTTVYVPPFSTSVNTTPLERVGVIGMTTLLLADSPLFNVTMIDSAASQRK